MLGADEWIKGFKFIYHIRCLMVNIPMCFFSLKEMPHDDFTSIEGNKSNLPTSTSKSSVFEHRKKREICWENNVSNV
jgi:hypothetical protein